MVRYFAKEIFLEGHYRTLKTQNKNSVRCYGVLGKKYFRLDLFINVFITFSKGGTHINHL